MYRMYELCVTDVRRVYGEVYGSVTGEVTAQNGGTVVVLRQLPCLLCVVLLAVCLSCGVSLNGRGADRKYGNRPSYHCTGLLSPLVSLRTVRLLAALAAHSGSTRSS